MNSSMIRYLLCRLLQFQSAFLMLAALVGLLYGEAQGWSFVIVAAICLVIGLMGGLKNPTNTNFYAKEGYVVVALSWLILSITGAVPFVLNGDIPDLIDAIFETASGFTTTGASILPNVELLAHCSLFWRSFTHFVGGMGVLVFMLAILPATGGQTMYLMQAESPGPSVGKLVPQVRNTAKILYGMYVGLTVMEFLFLLVEGMPVFDAITTAMGTAGTGGFGVKVDSIAGYSAIIQATVGVFMILFGVNFNLYFLLLTGKAKDVLHSEELRVYLSVIGAAVLLITLNIFRTVGGFFPAFHQAFFQVASIITTTGFATTDFNLWPTFSKTILVLIMFVGACAGSTGGGIKVSRITIMAKTIRKELDCIIHPRTVKKTYFEGHPVEHTVLRSINVFFISYMFLYAGSLLIVSLDNLDFTTSFTAVAATINNIGPGLNLVGPAGNFTCFSGLSKCVLIMDMLLGRLEIFPILVLCMPENWKMLMKRENRK